MFRAANGCHQRAVDCPHCNAGAQESLSPCQSWTQSTIIEAFTTFVDCALSIFVSSGSFKTMQEHKRHQTVAIATSNEL